MHSIWQIFWIIFVTNIKPKTIAIFSQLFFFIFDHIIAHDLIFIVNVYGMFGKSKIRICLYSSFPSKKEL